MSFDRKSRSIATAKAANQLVTSLYETHYAILVRFGARYLGTLDSAEDVVQEAFTDLYEALRSGAEIANAPAWATCVVRRKIFKRHEKASVRIKPLQDIDCEQLEALSPGEAADYERWDHDVRDLFHVLSRREEEVIVLRLSGMKYREIADELGVSPNSVNVFLARALRKLQAAAKEERGEKPISNHAIQPTPTTLQ